MNPPAVTQPSAPAEEAGAVFWETDDGALWATDQYGQPQQVIPPDPNSPFLQQGQPGTVVGGIYFPPGWWSISETGGRRIIGRIPVNSQLPNLPPGSTITPYPGGVVIIRVPAPPQPGVLPAPIIPPVFPPAAEPIPPAIPRVWEIPDEPLPPLPAPPNIGGPTPPPTAPPPIRVAPPRFIIIPPSGGIPIEIFPRDPGEDPWAPRAFPFPIIPVPPSNTLPALPQPPAVQLRLPD